MRVTAPILSIATAAQCEPKCRREITPRDPHSTRQGLQPGLQALLRKGCDSDRECADPGCSSVGLVGSRKFANHDFQYPN